MASLLYNKMLTAEKNGDIDFATDSFKCMLVTEDYVPDKDTHEFRDDVTDEVTGTGYTTGGDAVTVGITEDLVNDRVDVSLGDASWATATITARGAVYYQDTGNPATDRLIAYIDFGGDVSSTAGTFALSASTYRTQN